MEVRSILLEIRVFRIIFGSSLRFLFILFKVCGMCLVVLVSCLCRVVVFGREKRRKSIELVYEM